MAIVDRLDNDELTEIVDIQLERLRARPAVRDMTVEVTDAKAILDGAMGDGDTVTVDTTAPVEGPTSELVIR